MGNVRQVRYAQINSLFRQKDYAFKSLEFERGLGIVDDAFYLTLESDEGDVVIKVITNLRCVKNGKTLLRYHDLFIKKDGKEITKREFRSQLEIEKTALKDNLELVNRLFSSKHIGKISFSHYGDLKVSLPKVGSIIANDNLDVSKGGRRLYELLFLNRAEPFGVVVSEYKRGTLAFVTEDFRVFPEKGKIGIRFIVDA